MKDLVELRKCDKSDHKVDYEGIDSGIGFESNKKPFERKESKTDAFRSKL